LFPRSLINVTHISVCISHTCS